MIPREILKKVHRIEIKTRRLVKNVFGGEYHSVFKGRGITFSEVREYQMGDDVRLIDWNVTAKLDSPFVKVFDEERELTVFILFDASGSAYFGTRNQLKTELAAEVGALIGFSAFQNNDKVGLLIFTDEVERFIPPKKGSSNVLRLIRELLYFTPEHRKTNIDKAVNHFLRVAKRRSVVFLISDFLDHGYERTLQLCNQHHDLICLKISDPMEEKFVDVGLVKLHDPETDETFWLDSSRNESRRLFEEKSKRENEIFEKTMKQYHIDVIPLRVGEDYVDPIVKFFRVREKRY